MTKIKNGSSAKSLLHFAIMCAIIAIFSYLPPLAPITESGMYMLGVFFGFIYGVTAWQLTIPSLFGIFMLGWSNLIGGQNAAVAGSFGGEVLVNMLFLFVLVQLVQDKNIPQVIATWSLSRKYFQGKAYLYCVIVMITAVILGMVNMFLSIFVLWTIMYGILNQLGYEKHEAFSNVMLIGIVFFSMMGLILFPFVDNGLIIMGAYAGITGAPINYVGYVAVVLPTTVLMTIVWVAVGKYVFKMDMTKISAVDSSMLDLELLKLKPAQKVTMFLVVLYLFIILGKAMLPKDLPILKYLTSANLYLPILIILIIGTILHFDGKPLMNVSDLLKRGFIVDTWCLTCFVMLLTAWLTNAGTGITAFCVSILQPILGGMPVYAMVCVVMVFAFLVTNVANNIVVTLCIIPIMFALSKNLGFAMEPVALVVMMASHLALLTPAASGPEAVMFGNEEWISKGDIYKFVPILLIAMLIVDLTFGYFWANIIF